MPCDHKFLSVKTPGRLLRGLFAHALLWMSPIAVLAANTTKSADFAGIYVARVAKAAPSMTVSLGADGTATVTGDLGKGSITSFGLWQGDGRQVKVTFNAEEGAPADPPMVFELGHDQLQAVTWSRSMWGQEPPPVMKKGYKVKYLFWSATMR
jgi:hypothetical protein